MNKQGHSQTRSGVAQPGQGVPAHVVHHGNGNNWSTAAIVAAIALAVFLVMAYWVLPDALPVWTQRLLALINAILAVTVFVLATHREHHPDLDAIALRLKRGHHPDFGKQLQQEVKHQHHAKTVNLPVVGETSLRAISGSGIFVGVLLWWLTPWAPILVRARDMENLSIPLGIEIEDTVLMLADTQLAVPHPPVRPAIASALASAISLDSGPYLLGQKATVEGRYDDSRQLLNTALAAEKANVSDIRLALAQNELFAGKYVEAAKQYDQVLLVDPNDPTMWAQAAIAWLHAGDYNRAGDLANNASAMCEPYKDSKDAVRRDERARCLHVQAAVYTCHGKEPNKAGRFNKQVQDVWRDVPQQASAFAASVNNQAVLFQLLGKYPGAQNNHNLAYSTWSENLGARHPYVAVNRGNLAMLYYAQGRYADADRVAQQVAELRGEALPRDHPAQAMSLNLSALIGVARGDYAKSLSKAGRALGILEEYLSPQHPEVAAVACTIGGSYQGLARYRKAEYYLWRMADINHRTLGDKHPYLASSFARLAGLYLTERRYSEARIQAEQARKIDEAVFHGDHPAIARDLRLLAQVMILTKDSKEARPLLDRALAMERATLPNPHPEIAATEAALAALDDTPETYEDGVRLYKEALETDRRMLGDHHPTVAQLQYDLAKFYLDQGKYTEATDEVKRCIDNRRISLVPYHPQLADALDLYAAVLRKTDPSNSRAIERLTQQAAKIRNDQAEVNAEDVKSADSVGG